MTLVFATHNIYKYKEVAAVLPASVTLLRLDEIGCREDIPETGATLAENALLKAQYVYKNYGYSCFADDTGLEVAALHGAPGVHSARYAGESKNTAANVEKLLAELQHIANREACFRTVIALVTTKEVRFFEGIVRGIITSEKRGTEGFGYDPVFCPEGYAETYAELAFSVKNRMSHRAKAIQALAEYLQKEND